MTRSTQSRHLASGAWVAAKPVTGAANASLTACPFSRGRRIYIATARQPLRQKWEVSWRQEAKETAFARKRAAVEKTKRILNRVGWALAAIFVGRLGQGRPYPRTVVTPESDPSRQLGGVAATRDDVSV
jgi:hypothetical protein